MNRTTTESNRAPLGLPDETARIFGVHAGSSRRLGGAATYLLEMVSALVADGQTDSLVERHTISCSLCVCLPSRVCPLLI